MFQQCSPAKKNVIDFQIKPYALLISNIFILDRMKIHFDNFKSEQKFVSGTGVSIAVQITNLNVSGYVTFG